MAGIAKKERITNADYRTHCRIYCAGTKWFAIPSEYKTNVPVVVLVARQSSFEDLGARAKYGCNRVWSNALVLDYRYPLGTKIK